MQKKLFCSQNGKGKDNMAYTGMTGETAETSSQSTN